MRSFFAVLAMTVLLMVPAGAHEAKQGSSKFVEGRFTPPDVTLVDQSGAERRFIEDVAKGHRLVISFFYESCTTLCPISNLVMASVAREAFDLPGKPVRLVSVTVDPERDTPEVLRSLARSVGENPGWTWLTGAPDHVRTLTHGLGLQYDRPEDHAVLFIVADADSGRYVSTLGMPEPGQILVELKKLSD